MSGRGERLELSRMVRPRRRRILGLLIGLCLGALVSQGVAQTPGVGISVATEVPAVDAKVPTIAVKFPSDAKSGTTVSKLLLLTGSGPKDASPLRILDYLVPEPGSSAEMPAI